MDISNVKKAISSWHEGSKYKRSISSFSSVAGRVSFDFSEETIQLNLYQRPHGEAVEITITRSNAGTKVSSGLMVIEKEAHLTAIASFLERNLETVTKTHDRIFATATSGLYGGAAAEAKPEPTVTP